LCVLHRGGYDAGLRYLKGGGAKARRKERGQASGTEDWGVCHGDPGTEQNTGRVGKASQKKKRRRERPEFERETEKTRRTAGKPKKSKAPSKQIDRKHPVLKKTTNRSHKRQKKRLKKKRKTSGIFRQTAIVKLWAQ